MGRLASAVGLLVGAVGVWASYEMFYHPSIDLRDPIVLRRTPVHPDEITLVFGGDFAPADAAMDNIQREGYHYPYLRTATTLADADIAFANLEAPVTPSTIPVWIWKTFLYRVEPVATETWQWLGLDVVSLANNHVLDYRTRGLLDTVTALDGAGIAHVGAGVDASAARTPVIFTIGETRIGFLAYLENQVGFNLAERLFAQRHGPGCAQLNRDDLAEDVRRLRPQVDLIVVSVHWGENYSDVTHTQRAYADYLTDLGVDLVVGHHPHNEQRVAVRNHTLILYSLGNYAWGAPGHFELRIGLLARVRVAPRVGTGPARVKTLELLPIVTQNRLIQFQPRRVSPAERDWLQPLIDASRAEGTHMTVETDDEGPWLQVDLAP